MSEIRRVVRRRGRAAALASVLLVGAVAGTAISGSAAASVAAPSAASTAPFSTEPAPAPKHSGVASDAPITQGSTPSVAPPAGGTEAPAGTGASGTDAPAGAPLSAGAAQAPLPGFLHTDGATIVTADGSPYVVKGIAWFGLETGNCAPHGLWSISLDQGLQQIAAWGFNTIRLPYSNECLAAPASTSINATLNPDLATLPPLQLMDAVIARAKAYGLNVILDRHRPDSGAQSALWYTDRFPEATWIADWTMLAERYKAEPSVIGFDLHNEPHGAACWGCGDPAVDWQAAATRAGDAVLAVNPELLIIVEGVEKQGDGTYTWWGGGLADAGSDPVSLSVPDRVVYSPHDYPASIYAQSWFSAPDYPANLASVWEANWGYLVTQDIAPVFVGEFGSKLQTDQDRAWFENIVGYLAGNGISFAYWSFNPNSGDTGGLVADDWVTPQAEKVAALSPLIGTGTAVVAPAAPAPVPTPSAPGAPDAGGLPGPSPTPVSPWLRPVDPIGGTAGPGDPGPRRPGATPAPSTSPSGAPTTAPSPAPTGGAPEPAPSTTPALSATWAVQSEWSSGYVAEVTVSNRGGAAAWTLSWPDPNATGIANAWGMDCAVASGTVSCTGAQWARFVPPGQSVTAGVQVTSTSAPKSPAFSLTTN